MITVGDIRKAIEGQPDDKPANVHASMLVDNTDDGVNVLLGLESIDNMPDNIHIGVSVRIDPDDDIDDGDDLDEGWCDRCNEFIDECNCDEIAESDRLHREAFELTNGHEDGPSEDMDGDHETGLRDAGMGVDEDYGSFIGGLED